jgi:hypothetical protein
MTERAFLLYVGDDVTAEMTMGMHVTRARHRIEN